MPKVIDAPIRIKAAGSPPKLIEEYIGMVASKTSEVSIAKMVSPMGWQEPGQTPQFDEYTIVLKGTLRCESKSGTFDVGAGQAIITRRGEWIRYSSPKEGGAEYIAICLPAFSPLTVHRDVN